jgi:hypothetical protein
MRRLTRALRAAALVALLAPALAAAPPFATSLHAQPRWTQIGTTSQGNPVFIDRRSVKTADGIITATIRVTFNKPVSTPKGPLTASRAVAMFDCAKRTMAAKESIMYHDEKAGRIFEKRTIGKPGFGTTIKGSFGDVALEHLCAAK